MSVQPIQKSPTEFNAVILVRTLFLAIFIATCALSVKAVYDIANNNIFPVWFVPSFGLGVLGLLALCFYFVFQVLRIKEHSTPLSGKQPAISWALMAISYICTTSVHGFYPFRSNIFSIFTSLDLVLKINFTVAIFGFTVSVVLAGLYLFSRMKTSAVVGLLVMALLTLIPNDNCHNPFNYWWIETIGVSPLMYTPNLFAVMFVIPGLYGIHPKGAIFLTMCVCFGSLALGLGHQIGIIW